MSSLHFKNLFELQKMSNSITDSKQRKRRMILSFSEEIICMITWNDLKA